MNSCTAGPEKTSCPNPTNNHCDINNGAEKACPGVVCIYAKGYCSCVFDKGSATCNCPP